MPDNVVLDVLERRITEVEKDNQNKNEDIEPISGTKIRNALIYGDTVPNTFIRKNIMNFLRKRMDSGNPLFVE